MPEPAGGAASAPDPQVVTVPGWAQELLDAGIDPEMVNAAVEREKADAAGPPPTSEQRAAAAAALREQAQADYDATMAAAQHTRDHADSLREAALAAEDKAEADKQATLAQADEIDAGGVG
jgi:hypothetical protein